MALGALTLVGNRVKTSELFIDEITIVGDTSYPTGGSEGLDALLQAETDDQRAIFKVEGVAGGGVNNAAQHLRYDAAAGKLLVFDEAGVEIANTTALNGNTYSLLVYSR